MKHYLNLILLLFFSISLSAQQTETVSHKLLMIDAINRGDYAQATKEISYVNDWFLICVYNTTMNRTAMEEH